MALAPGLKGEKFDEGPGLPNPVDPKAGACDTAGVLVEPKGEGEGAAAPEKGLGDAPIAKGLAAPCGAGLDSPKEGNAGFEAAVVSGAAFASKGFGALYFLASRSNNSFS